MSNSALKKAEEEAQELLTVNIEHAVKMGEAWKRLQKNADFKKVIMDGYLNKKVLDSVSLLAVPQIKQRGERPEVMEDLISASNLQYYFMLIEHEYEGATQPILSDEEEEELEEMAAQGQVN